MTPDEIRALYVEALARAHGCAEIDESQHDASLKRGQLAAIEADVDTLAAAGLLPTGIEWGAGEVEDHTTDRVRIVPHDVHEDEKDARADALVNGEPLMQRFSHDWREVAE